MNRVFSKAATFALAIAFGVSAHAQSGAMNHFELASHARSKARSLTDAKEYEAALAVLNSLEAGKYEEGDAATQAAAAKIQGVLTDKGRIFIKLGRFDQADVEFLRAFDANISKAEKDLREFEDHRDRAMAGQSKYAPLAEASALAAYGALNQGEAVVSLRESNYVLVGATASEFDPARLAKHRALKKTVSRYMIR